ncbi:uncharacterized protein F5891DRAFT_249950 [Suillus fuscotomentosus]|uniref:Secreted protein n=1 Tax=Suillus fuscotomentosus TaxID=1912939 RepID=A0AAD4EAC0_9AGAM|nr:uncharacterized protein F5891DRAFT_249950 [Suillus fuscotomentosus]KAG1901278.1 hypothetical protein F5891DRAFT_249950 [Suillus fuscotomentosus]
MSDSEPGCRLLNLTARFIIVALVLQSSGDSACARTTTSFHAFAVSHWPQYFRTISTILFRFTSTSGAESRTSQFIYVSIPTGISTYILVLHQRSRHRPCK